MWSGPLAATMFSVPPDYGFSLLVAAVGAVDEPVLLDVLEHAARPPAAMARTASVATRFEALGMDIFLLVYSAQVEADCHRSSDRSVVRPSCDDCLPTERFCGNPRGFHTKKRVVARL